MTRMLRSPLCRSDALLGLDLDEVLTGDYGVASGPLVERTKPVCGSLPAGDIAWGSWREREAVAFQKRCRRKAAQWNAKMQKRREEAARKSRGWLQQDAERRRLAALRREVPYLKILVCSSVPDWWALWTILWIDIGLCMQTLGEHGIATNRQMLIKDGASTLYSVSDQKMPCCGLCLARPLYLVSILGSDIVRCLPCWIRHRAGSGMG